MNIKNIEKFYDEILRSKQISKRLQDKLSNVQNITEYKTFIKDELLPIAKSKGYDFDVDDILSYDKMKLKSLSEEELENVIGGKGAFKKASSTLMAAFTLLSPIVSSQTKIFAVEGEKSPAFNQGVSPKNTGTEQDLKEELIKKDPTLDEVLKKSPEQVTKAELGRITKTFARLARDKQMSLRNLCERYRWQYNQQK